ncbi:MAG: peptidoglycan-binding protein [Candidatus Paceibacteria bacterium]
MKYILTSVSVSSLILAGLLSFAAPAAASVPPYLILSPTGAGDNVQVNVTGDPNVSVLLSYAKVGAGAQITSIGSTNASGSFSLVVSSATYGLTSGTPVTAILNGTGGLKSQTVAWPTVASASSVTLSQSAVVVNVGSSATLSATNLGGAALYVSNNSNASIANVSISGSQVAISGNTNGSTTVTLCQVGNTTNCPSVYVVVEPSGTGQLAFSQNNVTVVSGQNLPITISGGNGAYQIVSNPNQSTIQASIASAVLTLTTGVSTGSSSIVVCSTDMALCGVVNATAGSTSSVAVSFSNSAPVVAAGQNVTVNVYGPSGVQFYVSSNSSPSVVQANLSGTTLTLTGITAGTSSVALCATTSTCATLTVTVQAAITGGNLTLSQNTLSILSGQSFNITVSGGTAPYNLSGGTSAVSQETLNGTTLTVYGVAGGTSSVNVCSAAGGCMLLVVNVNGPAAVIPVTTPVTTTPTPQPTVTPVTTSTVSATPAYVFTKYLAPGAAGSEVTELQKTLAQEGFLKAAPNGYYGAQTKAAVSKFQAAHGMSQLGVVGPSTRSVLNQLVDASSATDATIANMSLTELKAKVQLLQSQLTQALGRISKLTGQ